MNEAVAAVSFLSINFRKSTVMNFFCFNNNRLGQLMLQFSSVQETMLQMQLIFHLQVNQEQSQLHPLMDKTVFLLSVILVVLSILLHREKESYVLHLALQLHLNVQVEHRCQHL